MGLLSLVGCSNSDDAPRAVEAMEAAPALDATGAMTTTTGMGAATGGPSGGPTTTETTLPPPVGLEELAPGLLSAEQLGVPDTWAALDFDPALLDDPEFVGDVDPFRGLVTCPPVVRDAESPWISRKLSAIDAPLDNGLLSVEVILELESATAHADDVTELATCEPVPEATMVPTTGEVELEGVPPRLIPAVGFQIVAGPTDEVPFPYVIETLWVNADGFTVGVVLGGEPEDPSHPEIPPSWTEAAERTAAQALGALISS